MAYDSPRSPRYVAVFGSSQPLPGSAEYEEAMAAGRLLARAGLGVLNGGYGGTMEASAKGAREEGGAAVGVTVEAFGAKANPWIEQEVHAQTLFERLERLIRQPDGYLALKGGTGTLVEAALAWEFLNKRLIPERPLALVGAFWRPLVEMMAREDTRFRHGPAERCVYLANSVHDAVGWIVKRISCAQSAEEG